MDGSVKIDAEAPKVAGVYARGSLAGNTWTSSFLNKLSALGLGDSSLGFKVEGGVLNGTQPKALPWSNLNQISVVFTEDVDVQRDYLMLTGVGKTYNVAGSTFAYNPATKTATWTFAQVFSADRMLITMGRPTDLAGNTLDGEWSGTYPSGNSISGGALSFRLNVLPGDVTRNGQVSNQDIVEVTNRLGQLQSSPNYSVFADLNGNGQINNTDVSLARTASPIILSGSPIVPDTSLFSTVSVKDGAGESGQVLTQSNLLATNKDLFA